MLRVIAAFGRLKLTSPAERPIHLTLAMLVAFVFLISCETSNYAPRVTSTSAAKRNIDQTTPDHGRMLFVHRCIECHTLPAIWKYSREDWPKIVNDMSHRASLNPQEREAVIAYILAVRKQE
jgi:mono/diheme cytochrome c family protein